MGFKQFADMDAILSTKFDVNVHSDIPKLNIYVNDDVSEKQLLNCQYKITNNEEKNVQLFFKYNDQVEMAWNTHYKIYVCNEKLFVQDKYVFLQEVYTRLESIIGDELSSRPSNARTDPRSRRTRKRNN